MADKLSPSTEALTILPKAAVEESGSNHLPPDYRKEIVLLDDSRATIRPILWEDRNALVEFHSRLSDDTRFLRYHYFKGELTEDELKNLCNIDYSDVMALVAEKELGNHKDIIGVGRYIHIPPGKGAEVAFVVQDNEQQKGVGTQLLWHLSVLAYQRGINQFIGEVLRQNGRMLSIFRKADPKMGQEIDSPSTCIVNLSVAETMSSKSTVSCTKTCAGQT